MSGSSPPFDAVVVGGGFYGATIALYLAAERGMRRVMLIDRASVLLSRASYNNQARVHNGYHYPRSFTTAYRSRLNLPRFVREWADAVKVDFVKLYAIARRNSKVTSRQFERFCIEIGASIKPARKSLDALFDPYLIERVYEVEEYAFNSSLLNERITRQLRDAGVVVQLNTRVDAVHSAGPGKLLVSTNIDGREQDAIEARYVFNCTYSGLNQLDGTAGVRSPLKHEITEMPLIRPPAALADVGITVMDGPFFSIMPFPAEGLHTLSHVRYTPHLQWDDERGRNPYDVLDEYPGESRFDRMIRDSQRYVPQLRDSQYVKSLFEIKTVLKKNETDDGRPILFETNPVSPGLYSILGGKIDNIYDALEKIEDEIFAG
ncbi:MULTISPECIES: NAD(P)/FAD-dependent oxidoreductase [Caballeronia]|uniref:NAD(P)/FAD-dependent oxidoreductase n=1 Tax=Caballeronia TaxID=1827195 RepID=UPI00158E1A0A|nr:MULTISPECIES: FAD-dependent oxidoreductase [Caballeronia]MCG7402265.1 FAD-binding oxidoreductase [Caballeronia zhejiangensis]MCI1047139.1 FAD-binding oxidoreductase [Caballeronia zhejiangensis]